MKTVSMQSTKSMREQYVTKCTNDDDDDDDDDDDGDDDVDDDDDEIWVKQQKEW